jgi:hypothetical protein
MLPQRSQYFSSMLCGRDESNFELIVVFTFFQSESPGGGTVAAVAGVDLPASFAKVPATGLDCFSKACFYFYLARRSLTGLPQRTLCFGFAQSQVNRCSSLRVK